MSFITVAAASPQGQLIGDEIFAAMAEYKVPPSAVRIIIVIRSSRSVKLASGPCGEQRAAHRGRNSLSSSREEYPEF